MQHGVKPSAPSASPSLAVHVVPPRLGASSARRAPGGRTTPLRLPLQSPVAAIAWAAAAVVAWLSTVLADPAVAQTTATTGAEAERPTAYVFEHVDRWTNSARAAEWLEAAGFEVKPLPLDESPFGMTVDLIFIGSFASEHPGYRAWMDAHAADLYNYVDKGHTLVQMTQADQVEAKPPFLPTTHGATRSDRDFTAGRVLHPENPLLEGIPLNEAGLLQIFSHRTLWETFTDQGGFEVMIAGDEHAQFPALMEGAYGQGRIILSALAFDKNDPDVKSPEEDRSADLERFNTAFFANLARHVVNVRNRTTQALNVTPSPRTAREYVPGSWTLAVLPDTQVYSLRFPGVFTAQTGWIVQNRERLDIRYVLHLGDIVNNNTPREWANARAAMSLLDGVVPYAMVPGNHDYGPSGDASTRDTLLNEYFPPDVYRGWSTFGSTMEPGRLDNSFHLFEAGGRRWIVIALEWGPRDSTIAWANEVMRRHADRLGILITHAYMNNNDRRYDHLDDANPQHYNPHHYATPGGVNDGEELWQKLVRHHNFVITLNGHVLGDGTGYLESVNDLGGSVHQMLSNYQMRELGGEAYMRLLEFHPDGETVTVKSYSPLYDSYLLQPDQQFQIRLRPAEVLTGG